MKNVTSEFSTERQQKWPFSKPTQSFCWRNLGMFSYMTYLFENNLCKYVRVICKTQSNIWVVHLQSKLKLIDLDFRPHWKKRVGTYNLMGHFNHWDRRELILATPTFPILKKYLRLLGRAMNVSAFRPNQRYAYCLEFIQFWSFKLVFYLFSLVYSHDSMASGKRIT